MPVVNFFFFPEIILDFKENVNRKYIQTLSSIPNNGGGAEKGGRGEW
jgi:hypothetical protein